MRDSIRTHTVEVDLQEGDTLVYLSDGIIEAQNPNGDPFGFDKLEEILAAMPAGPAEIQEEILRAVAFHAAGRIADDDRTVMVLRFDQLASHQAALPELPLGASVS